MSYISNQALADMLNNVTANFNSIAGNLSNKIDVIRQELRQEIESKHNISMSFKRDFKEETEEWRVNSSKENQRIIQILQNQEIIINDLKRDNVDLKKCVQSHDERLKLQEKEIKAINDKFDELTSISFNKLGKGLFLVVGSIIGWVLVLIKDIILKHF